MRLPRMGWLALVLVPLTGCMLLIDAQEVNAPRKPGAGGAFGGAAGASAGAGASEGAPGTWSGDVGPILSEYCSACHDSGTRTADVVLTSYEDVIASDVVTPGDADGSLIIQVLEGSIMPPPGNRRPSEIEIGLIRSWIDTGAIDN